MDSPPDLTLSLPTPTTSPTTAAGSVYNPLPLSSPKRKRTKVLCFDIQRVLKPKPPARKPDPSAPKITMPCSECGKKFWSWKALYGHMRCHPDRQWRGIHPPPNRLALMPEDYEAASCLLLLANTEPSSDELAIVVAPVVVDGAGECSAAAMQTGHRCEICWKVFSSGQALGGHKRCHWEKSACLEDPSIGAGLDLNMPAAEQRNDSQLVLRLGIGD